MKNLFFSKNEKKIFQLLIGNFVNLVIEINEKEILYYTVLYI